MKTGIKIIFILIFTVIGIVLLFYYWNPILEGSPGFSYNIKESRRRNVFITEYKPLNKNLSINNIRIKINEAWGEYLWICSQFRFRTGRIIKSYKQIFISVDKKGMENYGKTWVIDSDNIIGHGFGYSENLLQCGRITKNILPDTIKCPIVSIDSTKWPADQFPIDTIGYFVLYKSTD